MIVFRFLLFFCLPAFLLHPIPTFSSEEPIYKHEASRRLEVFRNSKGRISPWELFKANKLSYDRVFEFTELLEQESFWTSLNLDEFDTLVDYLIWIMEFGVPKSRPDLQAQCAKELNDFLDILEYDDEVRFSMNENWEFRLHPAKYREDLSLMQCGWIGDKAKHLGHWAKKNKGPLIIGSIVVVAFAVAIATGGVGASSAVAVGGALAGGAMSDPPHPNHINKPGQVIFQEDLPPPNTPDFPPNNSPFTFFPQDTAPSTPLPTLPHAEDIYSEIERETEATKEDLLAFVPNDLPDNPEFFEETKNETRDTISSLAHTILDGMAQIGEYYYDLNPFSTLGDYLSYLKGIDEKHEMIDQFFDGSSPSSELTMQMGYLPPPGSVVPGGANGLVSKEASAAVGTAIVGSAATQIGGALVQSSQPMTVYRAFSELTGEVEYVGISNNWVRRYGEHARGKGIRIEPIEGLEALPPNDARATEQALIEIHKLQKDGGTLINKINSIAESNPIRAQAVQRGLEILQEIEYDGLAGIVE